MRKSDKWIPKETKKGALHRQLEIPRKEKIPKKTLRTIVKTDVGKKIDVGAKEKKTVTKLMKKRANFALNVQKRRR